MMSNDTRPASEGVPPGSIARFFSGLLLVLSGMLLLVSLTELEKAEVPGAPVVLVYITIAALLVAAALNLPPLFMRLPKRARIVAYLAPFIAIAIYMVEFGQMQPVWEATPQGAKEAADRAAADAKQAAEDARAQAYQRERDQTARSLAEAEQLRDQLKDRQAKLEACFTTIGHRLPALEDSVKDSLHNPGAFEHVGTVLIVPDAQRNNVEMTFRAENAFSAIRTATVTAQLVADDCSVQNIGEPETE